MNPFRKDSPNTEGGIETTQVDNPVYVSRKKPLVCHIMQDKNQEIDQVKRKVYNTEFTWKKKIWPIDKNGIYTDKKGIGHAFFDYRYTDGQMRLFQMDLNKSFIDKCVDCGNTIGIDTKNAWELTKRKTNTAIWGVDSSYMMLLIVLAIIVLACFGFVMYLYGENSRLSAQLASNTASFLLGVNLIE